MRLATFILAASLAIPAAAPLARAADLKPAQSQAIDLGDIAGDAYYMVRPDGMHVVATLTQRDGSRRPVRFQTVLAPGQAVTFSTPRGAGEPPVSVSLTRQDGRVIVTKAVLDN